jgi:hypothetical protein
MAEVKGARKGRMGACRERGIAGKEEGKRGKGHHPQLGPGGPALRWPRAVGTGITPPSESTPTKPHITAPTAPTPPLLARPSHGPSLGRYALRKTGRRAGALSVGDCAPRGGGAGGGHLALGQRGDEGDADGRLELAVHVEAHVAPGHLPRRGRGTVRGTIMSRYAARCTARSCHGTRHRPRRPAQPLRRCLPEERSDAPPRPSVPRAGSADPTLSGPTASFFHLLSLFEMKNDSKSCCCLNPKP